MSQDEDIELIQSFVAESQDMIDTVEPILIGLKESDGVADMESINSVFRLFHSMKGAAGFLKMDNIATVTHHAETLLDAFRRKNIPMNSYYVGVELGVLDGVREMLTHIATTLTDKGMEEIRVTAVAALTEAMSKLDGVAAPKSAVFAKAASSSSTEARSVGFQPAAEPASTEQEIALSLPELTITPEMLERFTQESNELIDNAEQGLLGLGGKGGDERTTCLNEAFRLIHSFKGNCGFMQLPDMERLGHKIENVLDAMRSGVVEATEQNLDIMLKTLDILRGGLASISSGSGGVIPNCAMLIEFLDDLLPKTPMAPSEAALTEVELAMVADVKDMSEISEQREGKAPPGATDQRLVRKDIRVDLDKLDRLINLVGELVVAEAMVLRNPVLRQIEDENLDRAVHHLARISADLQDVAMAVRMIPLATTFKKMIRLVHDLSVKSGKKVNVELVGEDTEVDKNVIEQIGDPLVHIIRNSIDHGLEATEDRVKLGKPEKGTVVIEAKHDGGEVVIIVSDDGKGLDRDKILRKGIEKGLVKGDATQLSDRDIYALIFEPGFSTADKLTDISGRGVGMDVVKRNIEKLNGRVDIKTVPGTGTDIVIHIPLTLAIIDGMLVRVGDSQYAIPLLAVRESIRTEARMVTTRPDGRELVRVREELLPIVRLHQLYLKNGAITQLDRGILVIVESESGAAALLVDEIIGQHQIVIKGLSAYLGTPKGISGCAVLGDGHVSLILDVNSLLKSVETSVE